MTRRLEKLLVLTALGIVGCSGSTDEHADRTVAREVYVVPGVYEGDFPCSNCAAIAVTLWLRPDERFFLRQVYPAADDEPETRSYAFGRWRTDEETGHLVLSGAGPERRFAWLDEQRLELQTASPVEHVLARSAAPHAFTDLVRLRGESAIADGDARFSECQTGLQFGVAKQNEFNELRRRHRVLNPRGKVALTTVEARLTEVVAGASVTETLVVERVIDLKPGVGC